MSGGGRWFRLNTTWSQSEWVADLPPASRLAWVELLSHVKAHGYDGRVKVVTRNTFARMYGIPAGDVQTMLDAAHADGALITEGDTWVINGWTEHQGDPTARERVRRYRERKEPDPEVTDVTRNNSSVTATKTKTSTKTEKKTTPAVWSTKAGEMWEDQFKGIAPFARIGTALKPLVEKHGPESVLSAWSKYLADTDARYASPQNFAEKYGRWSANGNAKHNGNFHNAPVVTEWAGRRVG